MSNRFARLTQLFVVGKAVELPGNDYLWVQALNTYQRQEAMTDARVARARIITALKSDGAQREVIIGRYHEYGREAMIEELCRERSVKKIGEYISDMRADPDWKERMEIVLRTDEKDTAVPLTVEEQEYIATVNAEILAEMNKREQDEFEYLQQKFADLDEDEVIDEYCGEWFDGRGSDLAQAEYKLTELWYATRWCDATPPASPDEELDHSRCNGHEVKVFENRPDVKTAPEHLIALITAALADINEVGADSKDPKDLARRPASSSSPSTPNEPAESQPST
jgi:hypothetical protein